MAQRLLQHAKNLRKNASEATLQLQAFSIVGKDPGSVRLFSQAAQEQAALKPEKVVSLSSRLRRWSKNLQQLSKARLSALVVSTTAVGFIAGSGNDVDWAKLGWASVGTFAASASANTLNQIYEISNDAKMRRTMMRPLPLGRVTRVQAQAFAAVMALTSFAILSQKTNMLTAGLGIGNIALYAGVYTPMKVVSATNTWIGAVVGAIPPLMGWTAAAGSLEPGAGILAAALYFWQMPHFLALAWLHREDYMRGGYAMLSRWDPRGSRTAAAALRNSLYMLPIGAIATWMGATTIAFGYEATIAAGTLATTAAVFYGTPSLKSARLLFRFTLLFLPIFMLGIVVHRVPNDHSITFASLREKLANGFSSEPETRDGSSDDGKHWPVREFSVAPGPFLPVPYRLSPTVAQLEQIAEYEQMLREQHETRLKERLKIKRIDDNESAQ